MDRWNVQKEFAWASLEGIELFQQLLAAPQKLLKQFLM